MKVGDYVRTKSGLIGKLMGRNAYDENKIAILIDDTKDIKITPVIDKEQIIKSSPNIIDLIEVGDYVNGSKIIELATNIDGKILYLETDITEFDNVYACGNINIYEKDIKSIVTSEQFSQIEYRIGE